MTSTRGSTRRIHHSGSHHHASPSSSSSSNTVASGEHSSALADTLIRRIQDIDQALGSIATLSQIAETFNIRPILLLLLGLTFILLLIGIFEDFILGLFGFCYPAWASFKALEGGDYAATQQWLAYWIIYGFFSLFEMFSDYVLFWIPFYYVVKLLFIAWLSLPQFTGATVVYRKIVRPLMLSNQEFWDQMFGIMGVVVSK